MQRSHHLLVAEIGGSVVATVMAWPPHTDLTATLCNVTLIVTLALLRIQYLNNLSEAC